MIYYMDDGPFETKVVLHDAIATVVAYDDITKRFLAILPRDAAFWYYETSLDPPPPIPAAAAARKPQVGEVWIMQTALSKKHVARLVIRASGTGYDALTPDMDFDWYSCDWVIRPATPAESEPFRLILKGLKRSLGES